VIGFVCAVQVCFLLLYKFYFFTSV
jgi:hypothetical protein